MRLIIATYLVFLVQNVQNLLLDGGQGQSPSDNPVKTVPQLIQSFGYKVEEHQVVTEDGYILTLHRIPVNDRIHWPEQRPPPVFLGHCLVGSSAIFVFGLVTTAVAKLSNDGMMGPHAATCYHPWVTLL